MCESIVVVGAALSADVDAPTERVHSAPGARRSQSPMQPTGERAGRVTSVRRALLASRHRGETTCGYGSRRRQAPYTNMALWGQDCALGGAVWFHRRRELMSSFWPSPPGIMCQWHPAAGVSAAGQRAEEPSSPSQQQSGLAVRTLAQEWLRELLAAQPLWAVFLGIPGGRNDILGDNSLAGVTSWQAKEDALLVQLRKIDIALSGATRSGHVWCIAGVARGRCPGARLSRRALATESAIWAPDHVAGAVAVAACWNDSDPAEGCAGPMAGNAAVHRHRDWSTTGGTPARVHAAAH